MACMLAAGCSPATENMRNEESSPAPPTTTETGTHDPMDDEQAEDEYMKAHVVIADTSRNYHVLRDRMFDLAGKLQFDIDTMGRGYDEAKNLICLPEIDEDELYAGSYFPRRFPGSALSLEYLGNYSPSDDPEDDGTIALVVAITEQKEEAEAVLAGVKEHAGGAYIIEALLYVGCMH